MKGPPGAKDIPHFKMLIKQKNVRMEEILNEHVASIKNTGFADQRLCAMAYSKFEEAFLLLDKALRIDASTTEYGKVTEPTPIPQEFAPGVAVSDQRFDNDGA